MEVVLEEESITEAMYQVSPFYSLVGPVYSDKRSTGDRMGDCSKVVARLKNAPANHPCCMHATVELEQVTLKSELYFFLCYKIATNETCM